MKQTRLVILQKILHMSSKIKGFLKVYLLEVFTLDEIQKKKEKINSSNHKSSPNYVLKNVIEKIIIKNFKMVCLWY